MTPAEFKSIRHALGLSAQGLAVALRVQSGRTVRKWEAGDRDIPGPAIVAVNYMMQGVLDDTMRSIVPEHVIAEDAEGEFENELLIRLHRPRFLAWVMEEQPPEDLDHIEVAPGEWLVVGMWIDDPTDFETHALLARAATALNLYAADSFEG